MTSATDSPGNGYATIPNDLNGVERMCEQLYTAQDQATRKHAESVLFPLANNPRHLSQGTMILENANVSPIFLAASLAKCGNAIAHILCCASG